MSNYTPFPWVPSQPNGKSGGWRVGPAWLGYVESETNNDRHLISAAPDLLEALEEITDGYSYRFDLDSPSTNTGIKTSIARARAALAKAKGQP